MCALNIRDEDDIGGNAMGYNKKNSITIHFEENDELMKEIDSLVSERAKVIARSYIDQ